MNRPSAPSAWCRALRFAWFALLVAGTASAAPLKAELHALATQPRADAPEWIDVRLTSSSSQLLEGVLQIIALDDGSVSFVYRTQELALTTGPRAFRLLLPAPALANRTLEREMRVRFFAKGGDVWDLGKFPLHSRLRLKRGLVLAVGRTGLHTGEAGTRLWQSLRLERFAPEKSTMVTDGFITAPVTLDPGDFPTDPLVYCSFDAVLFEPGAFASLKEKPREALGQWLAAGGSVCVFATEPLDPAHVETLRTWLHADPAVTAPEFDAEGRPQPNSDGFVLAHVELGRLIVATRPLDDPDAPAWRRAAAFLWKLRGEQAAAVAADGHWKSPEPNAQTNWRNTPDFLRSQLATELTEKLLPKTVRVIPLPVILTILIGFIVAVGPLDYFVLGKLRARKWTWVLFPVVSIAFTALTMKLAEHYLGTDTHRGAFILTDLGSDGRVLRETRCELVLPAKPQEFSRETLHALAAPLDTQAYSGGQRVSGVQFEGQYPGHYTLHFPLAQWTPQIVRVSSLGGGTDESGVNWAAFDPGPVAHDKYIDKAHSTQERYAGVAGAMQAASRCNIFFARGGEAYSAVPGELSAEFLSRLTFMAGSSLLLVRPSPGSSGPLDDYALLEPGDQHHAVAIAVRREGLAIHAWRRVYPLP